MILGCATLALILLVLLALPAQVAAQPALPSLSSPDLAIHAAQTPGPGGQSTPEPGGTPTQQTTSQPPSIIQQILHLLVFNDRTMSESITKALLRLFGGMLDQAVGAVNAVIRQTLTFLDVPGALSGAATGGLAELEDLRFQAWKTMLTIAGVLLPLSLALTLGAALREGTVSVTGYASAREALLEWVLSVAEAGASWFLMQLALDLAHYASQGILAAFSVNLLGDSFLLRDLITGSITKGEVFITTTPFLLQLFVALFALLMVGAVAISLTLSVLARYVMLFLITAAAPLILILGSLRPLRWLASFWSRAIVVVILLGPLNALLLGLAVRLQLVAYQLSTGLVGTILALLVLVGVLSVLISANSMIARGVYGAAGDLARRALHATGQVVTLAFALAGAGLGGGLLGGAVLRGGPVAPAGSGGLGGPAGGATLGNRATFGSRATLGSLGRPLEQPYDAFRSTSASSRLAGELGHLLSAVPTPLTRGLGMGLRVAAAARQVQARTGRPGAGALAVPTTGGGPPDPVLDRPVDLSGGVPGMAAARAALAGEAVGPSVARRGMAGPQAARTLDGGLQVGASAMIAAQQHLGIGAGRFLHDLGYTQRPLEQASSQFLRQAAQRYAFGDPAPWQRPAAGFGALPNRPGAQDVAAAMEILSSRPTETRLATPHGIATLARLSYTLRTAEVHPTPLAVAQAARAYGQGDLLDWMAGAVNQLAEPPASLVQEIRALRLPEDPHRTGDQ